MKPFICCAVVLLTSIACQPKETAPVEQLYRSWEQQVSPLSSATPLLLTFRPDGKLLYRATREEAPCCSPSYFGGTNKRVTFSGSSQRAECLMVYCAQSPLVTNSPWTIVTLTDTDLILAANGQQLTFKKR